MDDMKRLGKDRIIKLLMEFSIPAVVGMLVSELYNVIDRIFIGNSSGALGIAGITIGFPIMIMQMAFGMLIGLGATSLVSIRLGQKNNEAAQLIVGNAVTLLAIATAMITSSGLIFLDPILRAFGASNDVLPYSHAYMSIIMYGTVFQTFSAGMNSFMRAEGKPKIAMTTMLIGAFLNIILAPLFIFVFKWGMSGAAFATVISQAVSATWIMLHFITGKSLLRIRAANLILRRKIVGGILSIGFAPFAMQIAQCILTVIMNSSLEIYGGDVAVSGMGIVNSLAMLFIVPIIGVNQGAQPVIGYNYGAEKYDRVKKALKYAIFVGITFATTGYLISRLFPTQLIAFFDSRDKALIAFGSHALIVSLFFFPVVGFQIVCSGYFQAVGKPLQSMILSLSRQVLILIPLLLILPRFMQLQGVIIAQPLADLLSSIITGVWLFRELNYLKRKHREVCIERPELAATKDAATA